VQNNTTSDIATALTQSIAADGQTPITADIPFNNHKATGLAQGTAPGDAVTWDQYIAMSRSTTSGTATTSDKGKCIAISAGLTIPNTTFSAGDAFSIYVDSASSQTITQGTGLTLRLAGSTSTGNRTLAARGFATIWFNSASEAIIMGAGLT